MFSRDDFVIASLLKYYTLVVDNNTGCVFYSVNICARAPSFSDRSARAQVRVCWPRQRCAHFQPSAHQSVWPNSTPDVSVFIRQLFTCSPASALLNILIFTKLLPHSLSKNMSLNLTEVNELFSTLFWGRRCEGDRPVRFADTRIYVLFAQ